MKPIYPLTLIHRKLNVIIVINIVLAFLISATIFLIHFAGAIQFPVSPLGQCYDGVKMLIDENAYPGAKIAYWGPDISAGESSSKPSHVELLLFNGTYIDPYYGPVYNLTPPDAIFDNMDQLDNHLTYKIITKVEAQNVRCCRERDS